MKSAISKIISIVIIVGAIILYGCIAWFSPNQHEFESNACYYMFGCNAEEFFNQEFDFYEETGDFRKTARIDRDGDLLIKMSKKQERIWMESDWFNAVYDAMGRTDLKVSPDLKVITIHSTENIEEESIKEIRSTINSIVVRIHFINGSNGDTNANITIIDKSIETGEEKGRLDISFGRFLP